MYLRRSWSRGGCAARAARRAAATEPRPRGPPTRYYTPTSHRVFNYRILRCTGSSHDPRAVKHAVKVTSTENGTQPEKHDLKIGIFRLHSLTHEHRRASHGASQRASTGGQNGPFPFSSVSDSFIYTLGMYHIPYNTGMPQSQPLQFSMPRGGVCKSVDLL